MKQQVKTHVLSCDVCQRTKDEHILKPGLLQPLPIPSQAWETISMDFIEGLPTSKKFNSILVIIDKYTKYGHFLPLAHPFTATEAASIYLDNVFKLHGSPKVIISDRDRIFTSIFWKELMKKLGTVTHLSSAYHPETDGQTERLNQCLEQYLRSLCFLKPQTWATWLPQAEWWYNSNFHTAIGSTPFEALYGYKPNQLNWSEDSTVQNVNDIIQSREHTRKLLNDNLVRAQHRMKFYADKNRSERSFEVGDEVYLKLQPYRQSSVALRKNLKLAARFYSPYTITKKLGSVAYQLHLPDTSRIHPVFHVSLLKKKIGPNTQPSLNPPDVLDDGQLKISPLRALDKRIVKRNNTAVTQILVQWANLVPENATWEDFSVLQSQFPEFDPWGQGSIGAGGIVTMEGKTEKSIELGLGIGEKGVKANDNVLGININTSNDSVLKIPVAEENDAVALEAPSTDT
ncbi:hypothetical protein HRI_000845000 [Hibiscus trionum]|uniref:Integrase catalytic domain-containing protein n=1 Tax=Hibiscus trionum TaxID=183268 RepID=A0A9W7H708_HIBTR|nr:hypothetical protein HRI_000845000 [Hibiscus trionum]